MNGVTVSPSKLGIVHPSYPFISIRPIHSGYQNYTHNSSYTRIRSGPVPIRGLVGIADGFMVGQPNPSLTYPASEIKV